MFRINKIINLSIGTGFDPCNQKITWNRDGEIEFIPNISTAEECVKQCLYYNSTHFAELCIGYTWYGELNKLKDVCVLFSSLTDSYECESCIGGKLDDGITCFCSQEGECIFTDDNYLGDSKAESEIECFNKCLEMSECNYYTWYNSENEQIHNDCLLFTTCETIQPCNSGCFSGNVLCNE